MLTWQDQAITISTKRYGERNYLSCLLTESHGKYLGFCQIYSRSSRNLLQAGQQVSVKWRARLAEQLGNFQLDLVRPLPWLVIDSKQLIAVINYVSLVISQLLPEREPVPRLYQLLQELVKQLPYGEWWRYLLAFELELLRCCGYPLMLDKCNVTGSKTNLAYISPRTGAAVSVEAAIGYEAKLLPWLPLLVEPISWQDVSLEECRQADEIMQFFINKFLFKMNDQIIPPVRKKLLTTALDFAFNTEII